MSGRTPRRKRAGHDGRDVDHVPPAPVDAKPPARPSRGGRPRKFNEPSRPVTVTLPESALGHLARIDDDRAKAIAKAARALVEGPREASAAVEVIPIGTGTGLLMVGPSRHLRSLQILRMVEIIPGRYILTVPSGTAIETIEVALTDLMDTVPESDSDERALLVRLLTLFRAARRGHRMSKEEILLVAMP
ncbi:MAG: hypothetical protein FJ221_02190 [Lentisphaerae bacterium]|nr:hypothetical protein [Lentisphaerota bacterium]